MTADYKTLWHDRCDAMYNERYYKVLQQKDEVIFFTREQTEAAAFDIRPIDLGVPNAEYFQLYVDNAPAARGCIERFSYEFWEAADIRTFPAYRRFGYCHAVTAFLSNRIVASGKTATSCTLPENNGMNRIIKGNVNSYAQN